MDQLRLLTTTMAKCSFGCEQDVSFIMVSLGLDSVSAFHILSRGFLKLLSEFGDVCYELFFLKRMILKVSSRRQISLTSALFILSTLLGYLSPIFWVRCGSMQICLLLK